MSRHRPSPTLLPLPKGFPWAAGDVVEHRPSQGPSAVVDGPWRLGVVTFEASVWSLRDLETYQPVAPMSRRVVRRAWRDGVLVASVQFPRGREPAVPPEVRGAS